jgi:cytochrome c biogenesis protein CcdA/thiol-disulfide isomerase/thioredoxin
MALFLISFVAGVLTVLAPCVLPLLPIIVGGSVSGGVNKARAYTVALSLGASVILFTLLLKFSILFINIPQYTYEWFSGGILILFGLVTLFPQIWDNIGFVNTVSRESNKVMSAGFMKQSFWGDVLVGAALGPVFSTCSPTYFVILATVLPASFAAGFADLLAYTTGLVLMLLLVALAGQRVVDKLGLASDQQGWFKRGIGALFIFVGALIFVGAEQPAEAWLISHVYDITKIEQGLLKAHAGSMPIPVSSETISVAQKATQYQKAPELASIDGYINTSRKPITIGEFKGKSVVLVDFWTYSCINCQRSLPYIEAWYQKYKDQGLVIIGVSTPEFAFEHVYSNVANAVKQFGLTYPIVLDNEYGTWNAFGNEYWPRDYLVDIDGYIVHDHAGEGDYDVTEKAIQTALKERALRLSLPVSVSGITAPANVVAVDNGKLGSPETYFGSLRNEYLGNGSQGEPGLQTLTVPSKFDPNTLYLGGTWNITSEYAEDISQAADIRYQYHAKNVYFVGAADKPVKIRITQDGGKPLGADRGIDVDANGEATIHEDRLYQLIGAGDYGTHVLEIHIEGPGLRAYTLTFG